MPFWWSPQPDAPPRTRILKLGTFFLTVCAIGAVAEVAGLTLQTTRSILQPARSPIENTPAEYGLSYEPVSFPSSDGTQLRGWFIPGGKTAVVLTHGHGGNRASMLSQAAFLRERLGYSTLLFDFRASGESGGDRATLGYDEWKDIDGAVSYLRSRPEVDPDSIAAWGASMGASALLLMGNRAHSLKAIVADSAFASGETLVKRFDHWFRLPAFPFAYAVPLAIKLFMGISPSELAPVRTVSAVSPTPILFVHGELDEGIPPEDALALYQAAAGPNELWIARQSGHTAAWDAEREEYERRVLGFFRRYLRE